jgi:hypothetical protein
MQTLRFLAIIATVSFAGLLAACGGGSSNSTSSSSAATTAPAANDLKSVVQRAFDAHPRTMQVVNFNSCDPAQTAQAEYAYKGIPGAHFAYRAPGVNEHYVNAKCLVVHWTGPGITKTYTGDNYNRFLAIGNYIVDAVGEPTLGAVGAYNIPVTVHVIDNDAGKLMAAKDATRASNYLHIEPAQSDTAVIGTKKADGTWTITLPN